MALLISLPPLDQPLAQGVVDRRLADRGSQQFRLPPWISPDAERRVSVCPRQGRSNYVGVGCLPNADKARERPAWHRQVEVAEDEPCVSCGQQTDCGVDIGRKPARSVVPYQQLRRG